MILTKGAHQKAKFQKKNDCSGEISQNLYFDGLLLLKMYKTSTKKNTEEMCLMTLKTDTKFKKNN